MSGWNWRTGVFISNLQYMELNIQKLFGTIFTVLFFIRWSNSTSKSNLYLASRIIEFVNKTQFMIKLNYVLRNPVSATSTSYNVFRLTFTTLADAFPRETWIFSIRILFALLEYITSAQIWKATSIMFCILFGISTFTIHNSLEAWIFTHHFLLCKTPIMLWMFSFTATSRN